MAPVDYAAQKGWLESWHCTNIAELVVFDAVKISCVFFALHHPDVPTLSVCANRTKTMLNP